MELSYPLLTTTDRIAIVKMGISIKELGFTYKEEENNLIIDIGNKQVPFMDILILGSSLGMAESESLYRAIPL